MCYCGGFFGFVDRMVFLWFVSLSVVFLVAYVVVFLGSIYLSVFCSFAYLVVFVGFVDRSVLVLLCLSVGFPLVCL